MADNPERVTYFAATDARGKRVPFGIKQKDRARHLYVIGKTGMGKSTMLENMAIQDIRNGEGLAFIDPHGATADKLLDFVPTERVKDVVYFAPFDLDRPIAFNVMEDVGYDRRHLVVSGLMATFKKIWVDAWSARMEYILSNTLLALLEYPGATLLGVNRIYTDKVYRKKVVENIKDPVVKDFWVKEFVTYTDRYTQEATPAIQNKIGQFTGNPLIRNIIGQSKSSFDIRTMMDEKKILIMNLAKGLVGETNMKLLGSMLTTRLFLAAMSRADASAPVLAKLPNFYFYVDEFQNFANETFSEILSEARKYKLNLTIAHQYIEQMDEEVRPAVFGNVGTTVVFRVGPFDAEVLETVFFPEFTKEDLVNLGFAQIYLTLMIDGIGSRPFSAVTIPPIESPPRSFKAEVIAVSRERYGNPRKDIENIIVSELAATATAVEEPKPRRSSSSYGDQEGGKPFLRREEATSSPPAPLPRERAPEQSALQQPVKRPLEDVADAVARGRFNERDRIEPPPSLSRTATDLKAILKTVAEEAGKSKENEHLKRRDSLKSILANVMKRSGVSAPADTPKKSRAPAPSPEARAWQDGKEEKPYEIPEDTLRKILSGDDV